MDALIYFYFISFFFQSGDYTIPPGVIPWHVLKEGKKGVTDPQ